jgi:cytochrome P450
MADIEASTDRETGRIDIQALGSQPLTQSMHAEILRLYIAILTLRNGEVGAVHFAGYNISKEDLAIIYSRTGAMNDRAWADAGRPPTETPLDRFDAERFLVEPQGEVVANADGGEESTFKGRQFSMDGLAGVFLPFGGGDRMCPGRHYAKTEMLMTFAHIFTKFDFELLDNDTVAKVQPNMGFAPFGSLPPTCQVPFRIRRKSTPL